MMAAVAKRWLAAVVLLAAVAAVVAARNSPKSVGDSSTGRRAHEPLRAVLGIDFGGEMVKACVAMPDKPVEFVLNNYKRKTPLAIAFHNGRRFVGYEALRLLNKYPQAVFTGAKALLGHSYDSPILDQLQKEYPQHKLIRSPHRPSAPAFFVPSLNVSFTAEEVTAMVLKDIRVAAEGLAAAMADGSSVSISQCVFALPPDFSPQALTALTRAAELAGLHVQRSVSDLTAAGLHWALGHDFDLADAAHALLLYGLGSRGACAAAVQYTLECDKGGAAAPPPSSSARKASAKKRSAPRDVTVYPVHVREIAAACAGPTASGVAVGGHAVDMAVAAAFATDLSSRVHVGASWAPSDDGRVCSMGKLLTAARSVKEKLSLAEAGVADVDRPAPAMGVDHYRANLTRPVFESCVAAILSADTLLPPLREVLDKAKLLGLEVSKGKGVALELFGGLTRAPLVKRILSDAGSHTLSYRLDADEAAALGAGYLAAVEAGLRGFRKVVLSPLHPRHQQHYQAGHHQHYQAGHAPVPMSKQDTLIAAEKMAIFEEQDHYHERLAEVQNQYELYVSDAKERLGAAVALVGQQHAAALQDQQVEALKLAEAAIASLTTTLDDAQTWLPSFQEELVGLRVQAGDDLEAPGKRTLAAVTKLEHHLQQLEDDCSSLLADLADFTYLASQQVFTSTTSTDSDTASRRSEGSGDSDSAEECTGWLCDDYSAVDSEHDTLTPKPVHAVLPLLYYSEQGELVLNESTAATVAAFPAPVHVLSVFGSPRVGKSTFLTALLSSFYQERASSGETWSSDFGFPASNGSEPFTRGLWIWGAPLSVNNSTNGTLVLLDAEGYDDFESDWKIAALSALSSSGIAMVSRTHFDSHALTSLGHLARFASLSLEGDGGGSGNPPVLYFLSRDSLVPTINGLTVSVEDYTAWKLATHVHTDGRDELRARVTASFSAIMAAQLASSPAPSANPAVPRSFSSLPEEEGGAASSSTHGGDRTGDRDGDRSAVRGTAGGGREAVPSALQAAPPAATSDFLDVVIGVRQRVLATLPAKQVAGVDVSARAWTLLLHAVVAQLQDASVADVSGEAAVLGACRLALSQ